MQTICVYCGSSSQVDSVYLQAAEDLGKILAGNRIRLVYGGGDIGLMGTLAKSVLKAGGEVTGIIPRFMYDENWFCPDVSDLVVVDSMHERKQMMANVSEALVALPGGIGTLEELLEIITWKQLGLVNKPIVIANINNYYTPLLQMLHDVAENKFMRDQHLKMWEVVDSVHDILPAIKNSTEWDMNSRKFAAM